MDILEEIKAAAARNNVSPSKHAKGRMRERGARAEDVLSAILTAKVATQGDNGCWKLSGGVDGDGDELSVVVNVECDPMRVVTIM